ncbi:hypothetical protein Q3G72_007159 [Acer saccharum]|nr:hypothetical protein Q3G72_007159 [Acer saccharum]
MVAGKKCFEEEELDLDKITEGKLVDLEQTFGPSVNMALGDYFPYLRWLTYYGVEKQEIKFHKKRDAFIQALLDKHQNNNSSSRETSRPIIDVLLNLQESEPEFYTNDVVKGIIQAMLIAGTHTTVITLDSIVSQLIAHPEAFKKARDEINNQYRLSGLQPAVSSASAVSRGPFTDFVFRCCFRRKKVRLSNVPHTNLVQQNWVKLKDDKFIFPGDEEQLLKGADNYLNQISQGVWIGMLFGTFI